MPQFATHVPRSQEFNIGYLDLVYLAAVEAIEEAVVNGLVAGQAVATFKPSECMCPALDTGRQREIFAESRPETVA
jgi:D-aminopeptidase